LKIGNLSQRAKIPFDPRLASRPKSLAHCSMNRELMESGAGSRHSGYDSVVATIHEFCRSFDRRDWSSLRSCLAATLWTDYSSFRGTPPARISAEEFVRLRQVGLAGLVTQHLSGHRLVTFIGEQAHCRFDFVILRWAENPEDARFLHTFYYEMVLHPVTDGNRHWVINSITQHARRSEGSRELHGDWRATALSS
jgi:hypothetical protein